MPISIHALLAESDLEQSASYNAYMAISIHALLAESDPAIDVFLAVWAVISIHALLAESDRQNPGKHYVAFRFLSTLSLRRATRLNYFDLSRFRFLSTLSLRRATARRDSRQHPAGISIHALLAESDVGDVWACRWPDISIHALLAESDGI